MKYYRNSEIPNKNNCPAFKKGKKSCKREKVESIILKLRQNIMEELYSTSDRVFKES